MTPSENPKSDIWRKVEKQDKRMGKVKARTHSIRAKCSKICMAVWPTALTLSWFHVTARNPRVNDLLQANPVLK